MDEQSAEWSYCQDARSELYRTTPPHSLDIKSNNMNSTHNGRTPLHRQLPQRIPPDPLLRRGIRQGTPPPGPQRALPPHLRCPQRRPKSQTLHRPRNGFHPRGRQNLDPELPNQRIRSLKTALQNHRRGRRSSSSQESEEREVWRKDEGDGSQLSGDWTEIRVDAYCDSRGKFWRPDHLRE